MSEPKYHQSLAEGDKICLVMSDGRVSPAELGLLGREGGRRWSSLCSLVLPKESLSPRDGNPPPSHPCPAEEKHFAQSIPPPLPSAVLPFPPQKTLPGHFSAAWLIRGQAPAASGISQQLHGVSMAQLQGKLLCSELGQARQDTQMMLVCFPQLSFFS